MKYIILGAALCVTLPLSAGVFFAVDGEDGNLPNISIVHPPTFDGTGGELTVRLCVAEGSEQLIEPLRQAVQIWNSLTPTTGNCTGCVVAEENNPVEGLFDPVGTLLHEVGHCAMGLAHTNWQFVDAKLGTLQTSHTNTNDATVFLDDGDMIPGTSDDRPFPLPPQPPPTAKIIHWYRTADNNPAVVDGVVIDESTFTRALGLLPPGHTWPANSNRVANEALGIADTHSAMYSERARGAVMTGLTADEVNTVRFGMTGLDETAGTADDYTVVLQVSDTCDSPDDIRIRFAAPPMDIGLNILGECIPQLRSIPDPPKQLQHYALTGEPFTSIELKINSSIEWDFSRLYSDGFESGDLSLWDAVVP